MKVDYISDLHLDFHIRMNSNQKKYEENTYKFLEQLLPKEKGEVLVIAGDISHYNIQSYFALKFFSEQYDKVYFVTGNHDYYLVSGEQEKKYKKNSKKREFELFDMISSLYNVVYLNNYTIHEHNGVTFAGDTNWYPLQDIHEKSFFYNVSNDSKLIRGMLIEELSQQQHYQYDQLDKVEVLVTHVPSIQINSHIKYNSYYCYLNQLDPKAKHHVFGHCHEQNVYDKAGYNFYINALGYDGEWMSHMDMMKYSKEDREEFRQQWMKIKSFKV